MINRVLLILLAPFFLYCEPIKRIQIFGERCSGTNYLESLLKANCKNIDEDYFFYGWKHFPCWFDYPFNPKFYPVPKRNYTLENNRNCLFIIIFRDPYDWLRSLHLTPFHATDNLKNIPFGDFIRTKWTVDAAQMREWGNFEINPANGLPFKNVMKLRKARILNMLRIKDLVHNFYMINYETLSKSPEEVLREISHLFGVELQEEFTPILQSKKGFKKNTEIYQGSHYPAISAEDLAFINQQLDWSVEEQIGYGEMQEVPGK